MMTLDGHKVEKCGAFKPVSRRGPLVAACIATRRLQRFIRRNRLTPIEPIEVKVVRDVPAASSTVYVYARVVRGLA